MIRGKLRSAARWNQTQINHTFYHHESGQCNTAVRSKACSNGYIYGRQGLQLSDRKALLLSERIPSLLSEQKPLLLSRRKPLLLSERKPLLLSERKLLSLSERKPLLLSERKPLLLSERKPLLLSEAVPNPESLFRSQVECLTILTTLPHSLRCRRASGGRVCFFLTNNQLHNLIPRIALAHFQVGV